MNELKLCGPAMFRKSHETGPENSIESPYFTQKSPTIPQDFHDHHMVDLTITTSMIIPTKNPSLGDDHLQVHHPTFLQLPENHGCILSITPSSSEV